MPSLSRHFRFAVIAVGAVAFLAGAAVAQEIGPSHLQAALRAVYAAKASRGFDAVLPALSERVQAQLIRVRPDLHKEIADAVESVALSMVPLRSELDEKVAAIWAEEFTEDELNAIAAFYESPAGQKFADIGPRVIQDTLKAVQDWSIGLNNQMVEKSEEKLKEQGVEF